MNGRDRQRAMVLNRVEREGLTGQEAARLIGLSVRQTGRLLAAYREEGVAALAHVNRGLTTVHRISEDARNRAVELARGPCQGLTHYHLQEVLAERPVYTLDHDIDVYKPVICGIHGYCAAAGLDLALARDTHVASENAEEAHHVGLANRGCPGTTSCHLRGVRPQD